MPELRVRDRLSLAGSLVKKALFSNAPVQDVGSAVMQLLGQRRVPTQRGTEEMLRAYSRMPWLRAVVHRVSEDVSSVGWNVLRVRNARGKVVRDRKAQRGLGPKDRVPYLKQLAEDGDLEIIEEHPFRELMERADPAATGKLITGKMRRKLLSEHIDLAGDGFWLLERNEAGVPHMAWPLPPHWVTRLPTPDQLTFEVRFNAWTGEIPVTEVYWVSDADPHNPYGRGRGTAQAVADELETDEQASKMASQRFRNSGRPDFLASYGPVRGSNGSAPNRREMKRIEHSWRHRHGGFWRAFKPQFTNREVKLHELNQDFEQLQLTELRAFERDVIRQTFGVPAEIIGELGDSNRATSFNARMIYAENVLLSRLELFRDTLQDLAEREYDDRIIIQYDSPLPDDQEFQKEIAEAAPWAFQVDEIRELAGRAPLEEGGDVHMVPFQLTAHDNPGGVPGVAESNGNGSASGSGYVDREKPPDEGKQPGRDFWRLVHQIADDLAPEVRETFLDAVEDVRGQVDMEALENAIRAGNTQAAMDALGAERLLDALGAQGEALRGPIRDAFLRTAQASAEQLSGFLEVEVGFRVENPRVVAWINRHAAELVQGVTEESQAAIQQAVSRVFEEGRNTFETSRAIAETLRDTIGLTGRMEQAVRNFEAELIEAGLEGGELEAAVQRYREAKLGQRAERIARNETIQAANQGQLESWRQARDEGVLDTERTQKAWITTPDERRCPVCAPMEGQTRPMGEDFESPYDGSTAEVPPIHVQCRCASGLVFTDLEDE